MGLFARVMDFHRHTYSSIYPVLTPMAGGAGMMVSPKVLAAAVVGLLTSEPDHDPGCDCDLCKWRAKKDEAMGDVARQRRTVGEFVENTKEIFVKDDKLSESEVVTWLHWYSSYFPNIAERLAIDAYPTYLVDQLIDCRRDRVERVLWDITVASGYDFGMTPDEIDDVVKEMQDEYADPDYWRILQLAAVENQVWVLGNEHV